MKIITFSLEEGNKYYGSIDGKRFYIGARVTYGGGKGLMNVVGSDDQKYDREKFRPQFGLWADFIHPTAMAEGALYHTINTYDQASFTFSFLQFGAHVPNGDFVKYFRALLHLPLASQYFPDLVLANNRICRHGDAGAIALESDASTAPLIDYLNPTTREIEDTEVIQAARFIHWAQNDEAHRLVQITVGIENFKEKMFAYATQYGLDGVDDITCLVVADIRHQGRARSPEIMSALRSATPVDALLGIGEPKYHERLAVLRREIALLKAAGNLGRHRYSVSHKDFIQQSLTG